MYTYCGWNVCWDFANLIVEKNESINLEKGLFKRNFLGIAILFIFKRNQLNVLWIKKVIVPCHQATTAKFIRILVNDFNFRKVLLLNIHAIKGV